MPSRSGNGLRREAVLPDFDDIVGAIYQCVLEPVGWPSVLDRIRNAIGGAAAWIAVHYPDQIRSVYEIEVGTDPEQQRRLRTNYVASSPFIGAVHHFSENEIVSVDDVIDYDEFTAGRFYREWSSPQGWTDFILGVLTRSEDRFSWLGICLNERATPEHKRLTAAFLPHVQRALRISDLLELRTAQAADLASMVEGLATGTVLIDAGFVVRGINSSAERMIAATLGLTVEDERLRMGKNSAAIELAAAIAHCAQGCLDRAGATILFSGGNGRGILVHVLPLVRPRLHPGKEAVAALFLTDPAAPSQAPVEALVRTFGLTPSETRVLLAVLDGKSPRAIAIAQGVGMPTVRTHLSRVYEKTGTTGQVDVVRLMASFGSAI